MNDAFAILNINSEALRDFHLLANRIDDYQVEKTFNQNIRKLKSIEERMFVDGGINLSKQSIDEVIYKVAQASHDVSGGKPKWTIRELRIVSYYLMKLQDDETAFKYALDLLDEEWRNLYFNGLVFYLMNSWCLIKHDLRMKVSWLVVKRLNSYNDNNRRYLIWKNHANLFEEEGPYRLATLISLQNENICDAPKILGVKPSALSQSYFSDVIIKHCEKHSMTENLLDEIFKIHNEKRTKQLVFADLVFKADKQGDSTRQALLSNYINHTLGDVTMMSTWAPFLGATDKEAQKLKRAMEMVNIWFTKRIIETFFEICVQDKARKSFWMNYVKYIRTFKVVGSTVTKRMLQMDPRIGFAGLGNHFIETNSTSAQTSALVLYIKGYVLVEFSDTGALYAYKQNNEKIQFLNRGIRKIASTRVLKDTSMEGLVEGWGWYNDEGRMAHNGYWQSRLTDWIADKVLTSSYVETSWGDSKEGRTFAAKPLPKQEPIVNPASKEYKTEDFKPQETKFESQSYKWQSSTTNNETKNLVSSQKKLSQPFQQLTKTVYERDIKVVIASKWFCDASCRVIANDSGFYINVFKTKLFVKVRNLENLLPAGSIWIVRPNLQGWQEIVLFDAINGKRTIGFVKQAGGGVLFKRDMNQTGFITIDVK